MTEQNLVEVEKKMDFEVQIGNLKRLPNKTTIPMNIYAALQFIYLIPKEDRIKVISACWLHDTIEDCRVTYNDLKEETSVFMADMVYAVSNEKGKTRKERANDRYYEGIRNQKYATFIKLCDRIANATYSKNKSSWDSSELTAQTMFDKYKKEQKEFREKLYDKKYINMFVFLDNILEIKKLTE